MNTPKEPADRKLTEVAKAEKPLDDNPVWTAKALRPMTRKEAAFTRHLIEHPKDSATKAAKATYNTTTDNSASQIATENLRKPQILAELAKHSGTAELTLLEVMQYSKDYGRQGGKEGASYASVAASTANSLLDRIHGKATQRIEQQSTAVIISVDLTGVAQQEKEN